MKKYNATQVPVKNDFDPQLFDVFLFACEQLIEVQKACTWEEVFEAFRVPDRESFDELIKMQHSTIGMTEAFCIVAEITPKEFGRKLDECHSSM